MKHLDRVERELDLLLQQPAGIMDLQQAVQPAEGQSEVQTHSRNLENSSKRCSTQTAHFEHAKRRIL